VPFNLFGGGLILLQLQADHDPEPTSRMIPQQAGFEKPQFIEFISDQQNAVVVLLR